MLEEQENSELERREIHARRVGHVIKHSARLPDDSARCTLISSTSGFVTLSTAPSLVYSR